MGRTRRKVVTPGSRLAWTTSAAGSWWIECRARAIGQPQVLICWLVPGEGHSGWTVCRLRFEGVSQTWSESA
ncbi:MAG: hypothetical protein QG597_4280 [Actinomycetota bacterium]|nr:hypothetical protein [Actinomycetota bacterium]